MAAEYAHLVVDGREVAISNPGKVLFPKAGFTKLDLAHYYLKVAEGALCAAGGRPKVLVRYPHGVGGEFFYQKLNGLLTTPKASVCWALAHCVASSLTLATSMSPTWAGLALGAEDLSFGNTERASTHQNAPCLQSHLNSAGAQLHRPVQPRFPCYHGSRRAQADTRQAGLLHCRLPGLLDFPWPG